MKKQSAAGLFLNIFLRAFVIIMGVAILAFSVFFIMKLSKDKGKKNDAPPTTAGEKILTEAEAPDTLLTAQPRPATEAPATESAETGKPEAEDAHSATILVLNSTDVIGLAGRWCDTLNEDGYASTSKSDFSTNLEKTVIYSKKEGLGENLTKYFDGATYQVGDAPEGASISTEDFDIVIIIGNADDDH